MAKSSSAERRPDSSTREPGGRGAGKPVTRLTSVHDPVPDTRLRLLLVDHPCDGGELARVLGEQLPQSDVRVETTPEAALRHLADHRVDLVVADLSLPPGQGARFVRAVRSSRRETALLVVSGRVEGPSPRWVLAEGGPVHRVGEPLDGPGLATAALHAVQRTRADAAVDAYLQLARGLLDASEEPSCAVDSEGRLVAVNAAWGDFSARNGGTHELTGVGVSYLDVCDRAAGDRFGGGTEAVIVAGGLRHVLAGTLDHFRHDYSCDSPVESRWFSVRITPAVIDGGAGAVITHLDVTRVHELQRSVGHQSMHDPLTDLPSRDLMHDRLEQAAGHAERHGLRIAVTQLDLHGFREVNDRLGHRGGDTVMVQVAERLRAQLRAGDTLSRSSGDRFLVLWHGVDHAEEAVELSKGLVGALDRPFDVAAEPMALSACAGVALHNPGQGADELLRSSDAAVHDAKSQGPGHVVLFTEEPHEVTPFHRSLEAELRLALRGAVTQFVLHYQPVVDLTSGAVVGVEALVRWQHPTWGLLGPDRFIALAEATGLIHQLGDWVLDQAIRDAATLTHQGRELDVAVNFSVRQLDDQAVARFRRALESSGLRPGRLILEVTESAVVEDEESTTTTLRELSRLGVKISIDDFGTGHSSLHYLRRYPIDTLKIDGEFVAGIGVSVDDEAICASITGLAAALGASTVGEGVETMEQYAFLRSLGCLQGQGFLWSPAVPIDRFADALAACDEVPVASSRSRMARPRPALHPTVTSLITRMHAERVPMHMIASALNRTLGRHPEGGHWTAGAVARGLPAGGVPSGTEGHAPMARVLLCNDDEPVRRLLRLDLEFAGFEVEEAADGRAVMVRVIDPNALPLDAIVLDCQTLPYDARWAIAAIRAHHRLDDVPALLVTPARGRPTSAELDAAGFDGIVTAPFRSAQLVEAVSRLATTGRDARCRA